MDMEMQHQRDRPHPKTGESRTYKELTCVMDKAKKNPVSKR